MNMMTLLLCLYGFVESFNKRKEDIFKIALYLAKPFHRGTVAKYM
jgi:hypothetical protein